MDNVFGVYKEVIVGFGMLLTPLRIGLVVVFNSIAGVIFGWLYWRKGLEAAMIAHSIGHVLTVLLILSMLSV